MFTSDELQAVIKTLAHRRDWLVKNLDNPELVQSRAKNQLTLKHLESALSKLEQSTGASTRPAPKEEGNVPLKHLTPDKIRVLIVDDDNFVTSLISTYLLQMGIKKIDIAEDGLRAISMLYDAKHLYTLVLCDWNMPIKTGLDVHNAMRAAERYEDTCFMLVTGVTEAKQIRTAIEEGVDDYLIKPIDPVTLNKKIMRNFPLVPLADFSGVG